MEHGPILSWISVVVRLRFVAALLATALAVTMRNCHRDDSSRWRPLYDGVSGGLLLWAAGQAVHGVAELQPGAASWTAPVDVGVAACGLAVVVVSIIRLARGTGATGGTSGAAR
jgi:hypothetical protein